MQEPTFLILAALATGAQHGYGIMTDVTRISGGRERLRAGTLYAALDRLRTGHLVEVDREEIVEGRPLRPAAAVECDRGGRSAPCCGRDGMSGQPGLEPRYRRLLAWYPRVYRREHEEEMLAVLLANAREGQQRPGLAESADLMWGAVRMRLRHRDSYPGNATSDALAVFSLVAPLLLAGAAVVTVTVVLGRPLPPAGALRVLLANARDGVFLVAAGQLAVAAGVLLRLRRTALATIAVTLAWLILGPGVDRYGGVEAFFLACYLLEGAALIASPGPRRGWQLITRRSGLALAAAATLSASTGS
jgi:Transcriptional regulator PadR-like family